MKVIVGILSIIVLIFGIVYWNDRKHWYSVEMGQRGFKRELDFLISHDKKRSVSDSVANDKYRADSVRLEGIEENISKIPGMVSSIQKRYDAKRKHIDTLSADVQLQLFSGWLSEDSSSGK